MEGKQPLKGLKVVDFGWIAVEPVTMKYFADWGATVIRVESHKAPDILRLGRPYRDDKAGINRSGWWAEYNTSKLGMSLDFSNPKSKEVLQRLIRWADLVSASYRGEALKKWGLDYESVKKINPGIIYYESGMLGHSGPRANFRGYGGEATALAGFVHATGWPDREAVYPAYAYSDFVCPRVGAATILAALDYRRRTGKGLHLEQSQQECCVPFVATPVLDYEINGRIAERNGNRDHLAAPHGAYPCQGEDKWCTIAVFTEAEWQAFAKAIGEPELTDNAKFATLSDRKSNEDELDAIVSEWTKHHSREEVMSIMQSAGVAAGIIQSARDLFEDPQLEHRKHFKRLEHCEIGVHSYDGPSFTLSKTPSHLSAAPCLGQHNEYVYKEILGYSDDEIADFIVDGVITTDRDLPKQLKGVV